MKIRKIVLTGGPCAGKTTAISVLKNYFEAQGKVVAVAPEAATILLGNGFKLHGASHDELVQIQVQICKVQLALEWAMSSSLGMDGQNGVLICDRGLMDNKAYTSPKAWDEILDTFYGYAIVEQSWHYRYDVVIHLVSAAVGAEAHYKNNEVRKESIPVAQLLDRAIQVAWEKHPNRYIIDNSTNFAGKMSRVLDLFEGDDVWNSSGT